jgi:hypothetical protein
VSKLSTIIACFSLSLSLFQNRILGSGWIQGVCADILSHTWPVRGGDQPHTTLMPFQRISTGFCGSPDHPRRAETAERATWGKIDDPEPLGGLSPAEFRKFSKAGAEVLGPYPVPLDEIGESRGCHRTGRYFRDRVDQLVQLLCLCYHPCACSYDLPTK